MRILLTGASGFLGSSLAKHFYKSGHELALLLRQSSKLTRLKGMEDSLVISRVETVAEVEEFVTRINPDIVIHTACAYGRHGETAIQILDANVRLSLIIIQSLLRTGQTVTFLNTATVLPPELNLYALSKNQFSEWGRTIAYQSYGKLRFINLQLQQMYGPGDDPSKFTTHVLQTCQRNDFELNLTLGEQLRDFVYIDDVVAAFDALVKESDRLEAVADIEVGSGVALSIREFVETAHRLMSSRTKLNFGRIPYRLNEVMTCKANISLMQSLGWQPRFDLFAGLKKTIELEF